MILIAIFSLCFINDLYASALFLRMGNHMIRCVTYLHKYIHQDRKFERRLGAPPEEDRLFAEQMKDYLFQTYTYQQEETSRSKYARPRARRAKVSGVELTLRGMAIIFFFSVLNGGYSEKHGKFIHYCPGTGCCADENACANKIEKAVLNLPLASSPELPEQGKWTKTGPTAAVPPETFTVI